MTEATAIELVVEAFDAAWKVAQPSVPAIYEDEAAPSGDTQVLLTIQLTTGQQTTQGARGSRRFERHGWIQVKTWSPVNTGTSGATAMKDSIRTILEGVSIPSSPPVGEPVVTYAASAGPNVTEGRWFMTLTRIPMTFVETK